MINAELLEHIDTEFERIIKTNSKVKALYQKIRDGTATFVNAQEMAIETGKALSRAFQTNITVDILPNGKMTFETAKEVIRPEIVKGFDYTSSYFNQVQESIFKANKLNIKGAPPDFNESRVKGFIDKLTSDEYEKVRWLLDDNAYLINYFEAVVATGLKNNIGMLGEAGIRSTITREIDSGACPWCVALAGKYEYGEQPDDVFRRHRDCHCTLTYEIGNFRQDSWSKKWFTDNPNYKWEVKQRKEFDKDFKMRTVKSGRYVPTQKLTPLEAEALEKLLLNQ